MVLTSEQFDRGSVDARQLLASPELANILEKAGVNLSVRSPDEIVDSIKGNPRLCSMPFQTHESTRNSPSVIIEHGASVCSLLIAIDREGSIISVHKPLYLDSLDEMRERLVRCGFVDAVSHTLNAEKTFFLTATGANVSTAQRLALIKNLETIFGQKINFLFMKEPIQNQEMPFPILARLIQLVRNVYLGLTGRNDQLRLIGDMFIIPSAYSSSGKIELVIPHDSKAAQRGEMQLQVLARAVGRLKTKLGNTAT